MALSTTWVTVPLLVSSVGVPLKVAVITWLPSASADVEKATCPEALTGTFAARVVGPSVNVTVPVVTGSPPLVTVAVKVTEVPVVDGFGDELTTVVVGSATSDVVIVTLHPPVIDPESPVASSTTYRLHVPLGLVPLNVPRVVADPGAGAGAGNESAAGSPASVSVGR